MLVPFAGFDPREDGRKGRFLPYRPMTPAKTACPILRELFRISDSKQYKSVQVAEALGESVVTIHYWRAGKRLPDMFKYRNFAKFLGVELRVFGATR